MDTIKQTLRNNIYSLSVLQIANFIFPLLIIPYLLRTIGIHNYGLIAFAQSLIAYYGLIIDFGFNLSATTGIALEHDPSLRSHYFWKTIFSKVFLLIVCFISLIVIVHFDPFRSNSTLFYLAFLSLIGNCLFPNWYFQGVQKMSYIPAIQVPIRATVTLLIFIFVKDANDLNNAVLISGLGSALVGCIGFSIGVIHIGKRMYIPRIKEIMTHIKQSRTLFLGQAATSFFNESLIFLLGLYAGYGAAGIFASADKIINAVTAFIAPISWAIYPQSGVLFTRSKKDALTFLSRIYRYGFLFFSATTIGLFVFAPILTQFISGTDTRAITLLIRIMSPIPLTIFINNIYGTQILINTGYQRLFTQTLIVGAIVSVILSLALIPLFHEIGAGVVSLTIEVFIAWSMKHYCTRHNLRLSREYA